MRVKIAVTAYAVAVAVTAAWLSWRPMTVYQTRLFGPEINFGPQAVQVYARHADGKESQMAQGSAVLVDSQAGLYLTVAHLLVGWNSAVVAAPSMEALVPVQATWIDIRDDLAVIRVASTQHCRSVRAVSLADGPPRVGQVLTVAGYHTVTREDQMADIRGFVQHYRVVLQDQDSRVIFAVHLGPGIFGVQPGMSGGPVFDERGVLVGIVRGYGAPSGRYAFFTPAYRARTLIEHARQSGPARAP